MLFGKHICDYMIVVFTGGDELEEDGKTLEDFLCNCPQALKDILCMCGNRFVLFDNKANETFTEEMKKWTKELQEPTEAIQVLKMTERYSQQEMLGLMEKICVEHLNPKIEMKCKQMQKCGSYYE